MTKVCTGLALAQVTMGSPAAVIADIEALFIKAMGLRNRADMKFAAAVPWEQIRRDEVDHLRRSSRVADLAIVSDERR